MATARTRVYFTADVHLGLKIGDPAEREARFVHFLKKIPRRSTTALYLLGDIWDFWYEYRDVVPKEGMRVLAQLTDLVDSGVKVYFFEGNHDVWTYRFFEELGMEKLTQPYFCELGGKTFCLGHGDGLGGSTKGYRLMMAVFRSKVAQWLFSLLHPYLAFRIAGWWSLGNRKSHKPYTFRNEEEPIYRFAAAAEQERRVDCFVFGHYHKDIRLKTPGGADFIILDTWLKGGEPYFIFEEPAPQSQGSLF